MALSLSLRGSRFRPGNSPPCEVENTLQGSPVVAFVTLASGAEVAAHHTFFESDGTSKALLTEGAT
jgi:hypothetical protein